MVRSTLVAALASLFLVTPAQAARGDADVAALQVGLRARALYGGAIDGLNGAATSDGLRHLTGRGSDSLDVARASLGDYGRYTLGTRVLTQGVSGWDATAFQFLLSWQGFPSGPLDGRYTARTAVAVRKFQASAGLVVDGVAGPATVAAVKRPVPRATARLSAPVGLAPDGWFGPRDDRFHTGLDYPAVSGTAVRASGAGRVSFAGWHAGGYGFLVTIDHGGGLQTMYAHLARVGVRVGERVASGERIASSGASGLSSGPHLHFELRLRDAAVDPLQTLR